MKKINLRELYPDVYKTDHFVEVAEDVLETIRAAERAEAAYERKMYRYKAHYSLDCDNGIENAVLLKPQTPEMVLEEKQFQEQVYTRVSTSMQVDGYSLDAQRDKLRKYAAYEDMIVAGEYSDEGFSGKNIQGRQEFQRMLNDIQDGKDDVSYVLVFKLSRFGRNAADVLNSLQLICSQHYKQTIIKPVDLLVGGLYA